MSQSHEKQLIEALRVVCGGEKSEVSPELGDEIVKAIREEIAPLVELAAFPHREYLDEKAASFYCSTPVSTLQRKRVDGSVHIHMHKPFLHISSCPYSIYFPDSFCVISFC